MTAPAPTDTVIVHQSSAPNMLVRILWFLFVGWWAAGLVSGIAYVIALTVIGLPLALWMLNRIGTVATLRPADRQEWTTVQTPDGSQVATLAERQQRPWVLRALWFVLVGWWLTGLWLWLAWLLTIIVIGLPLAWAMYGWTGTILTLRR